MRIIYNRGSRIRKAVHPQPGASTLRTVQDRRSAAVGSLIFPISAIEIRAFRHFLFRIFSSASLAPE
jgi:hypothetical protein